MIELRISRSCNSVVVTVKINGQYIDSRVFHVKEKRDMLIFFKRIVDSLVRE